MVRGFERGVRLLAACASVVACNSGPPPTCSPGSGGHGAGTGGAAGTTASFTIQGKINKDLDLLFMIDNSSGMTSMQQKLVTQIPAFIQTLQQAPGGLPNLHIAVVSSDMGAPGDEVRAIGCTDSGDQGQFQYQVGLAATMCNATTLAQGDTFVSDVDGLTNFTDPLATVVQCVADLGASGCGFEHQLASIARALGADGSPPPPSNANFLRPNAYLGIILLTNEDDCSAPPNTPLFSLNGGKQSVTNPLGPLANYRCNQFGHLCKDPSGAVIQPPLNPTASTSGTPPMLTLTDCTSNDTGGTDDLTPVARFVSGVKALKEDPDNQILVAAITAPADPYTIEWVTPVSQTPGAGELWPQIMHTCGAAGSDDLAPGALQTTIDGSSGDPGVRIAQFAHGFTNSLVASICDPSYRNAMLAIATKLGAMINNSSCLALGRVQNDIQGHPACTVTNHLQDASGNVTDVPVSSCDENGNTPPCWTLNAGTSCPAGDLMFQLMPDQAAQNAASLSSTLTCPICQPGSSLPGC
ncbi:MAG TPA: hypothetical protein VN962_22240 [Polyangia bacterium]|nr:hypothetical protein [Polyangia bacterium]